MTLTVEKGGFAYGRGGTPVLRDISLEVGSGELVAVLGPNGCGKTTLLRCAMGFLRWDAGASFLDGRDILKIPYRELWRSLAYVPQARNAAVSYTVEETVMLGRGARFGLLSRPGPADIEAVRGVLERLGISHLAQKKCTQISGGELQMTLIARALAAEPKILVLDEPESNLDFKNQLLVLDTLSELAARGMACLFNTHYPSHALRRANKSLLFTEEGRALFGATREIVTEDNIQRAFGVRAVIGEFETPESVFRDVLPLGLSAEAPAGAGAGEKGEKSAIATLSILCRAFDTAERINALLHEYAPYLIGRMGMPYPEAGLHIINVTLDAPEGVILALTDRLSPLPGVSVKATYAKGDRA